MRARVSTGVAVAELVVATLLVVEDVLLPSVLLLVLAAVSLAVRRQPPASLGLVRPARPGRLALRVLGLTAAWTVLQLALFLPLLEHVSGHRQDLADFADLRGNLALLLVLLAASWTLAALGEEIAFRGYVLTRATDVLGKRRPGLVGGLLFSAVLFALLHTEQGVVGVGATFLDALFFGVLRFRMRTLWASVLAHGFNNTIGLTAFFLVGPIHGLW